MKLLTETELEIMSILWRLGEGTVNEVMERLPADRKLAYTSVSTMLRILEQKKIVGSKKIGRGHLYSPLLVKEKYEAASLNHLVKKVFDGTPTSLVKRLLDVGNISDEDLREIENLIEERKKL
jgi:predicted transcriptional regulator